MITNELNIGWHVIYKLFTSINELSPDSIGKVRKCPPQVSSCSWEVSKIVG